MNIYVISAIIALPLFMAFKPFWHMYLKFAKESEKEVEELDIEDRW